MASDIRLGSLNYVVLMGRAVADPDLKYTPKGSPVLRLRMAVNRRYKDATTGEWKDETSFFAVNVWGPNAERLSEVVKRGSALLVEGRLQSRSYETKNGEKRYVVEINALRAQCLDKLPTAPAEGEIEAPAPDTEIDIPADLAEGADQTPF